MLNVTRAQPRTVEHVECVMLSVTRTIFCGSTIVRDIRGRMIVRDIPFDYFLDSLSYRTIRFVQLT